MRFWIVCLLLLVGPAFADKTADSVERYYQRAMERIGILPTAESYANIFNFVHREALEGLDEGALRTALYDEINEMLSAVGCAHLAEGLEPDRAYPYLIARRCRGQLPERMVWLAACHGVVRSLGDPYSCFMVADEYAGIPDCSGPYRGPPQRPPHEWR